MTDIIHAPHSLDDLTDNRRPHGYERRRYGARQNRSRGPRSSRLSTRRRGAEVMAACVQRGNEATRQAG